MFFVTSWKRAHGSIFQVVMRFMCGWRSRLRGGRIYVTTKSGYIDDSGVGGMKGVLRLSIARRKRWLMAVRYQVLRDI